MVDAVVTFDPATSLILTEIAEPPPTHPNHFKMHLRMCSLILTLVRGATIEIFLEFLIEIPSLVYASRDLTLIFEPMTFSMSLLSSVLAND